MPTIVQFRRGTTAQNDSFTGSTGEISIDSTKDTIRVHDGSTAGGFEMINESGKGSGDDITFESATSNKPVLTLKNTLSTGLGAELVFQQDQVTPADNDVIGTIRFKGTDDGSTSIDYIKIVGKIIDASDSSEDAQLIINTQTAGNDAELLKLDSTDGMTLKSNVTTNYLTATVGSTSIANIDTFAKATFRTAKYIVQATQGSNYQINEILVTHDGTTAYANDYAETRDGGVLSTYTVDISSNDVRLRTTNGAATSTVYKIHRTLIAV